MNELGHGGSRDRKRGWAQYCASRDRKRGWAQYSSRVNMNEPGHGGSRDRKLGWAAIFAQLPPFQSVHCS